MDKVRCPYCGAEMEEDYSTGEYSGGYSYATWRCPVCNSNAPIIEITEEMDMSEGIDRALAAALQRYVEPNRVLTLEEAFHARPDEVPIWIESKNDAKDEPLSEWNVDPPVFWREMMRIGHETYGEVWRAWLRRPTDEERKAVAWDE